MGNGDLKVDGEEFYNGESSLIFLGTGCSSAVQHLSLLTDYVDENGAHKYILIDVGKTFREQVLRWFTRHKIPRVDSIILTHEHADAVLGLDDIRAVQPFSPTNEIDPTPIYLTQHAMESLAEQFPYLVKKKLKEGEEVRRVAQLDWRIIESDCAPFISSGLQFVPLPVMHGEDYVCLGFLFGKKSRTAYISDVSRFPAATEHLISRAGGGQLDLLILDNLYKRGSHNTHFCLQQSLEAVSRIRPKQALFIGMTHEFDHHEDNKALEEWSNREGIPVQLAHDGMRIFRDL
ncbi:hypothetical protein KFK09_026732 [Dendrobium nobile]|uniref:Metallo-beta-lactamase domain-containing protein n=1 Tax=Dendrobium nobile TaxID=94219 RepID=A0A8T3A8N9_DENNO|nr:hypothetical protein KFK09_026732 [Dendrobium nobile]